jgi:acetyl esterase/lipase
MSFDSLRPQTPIFPAEAERYAASALRMSQAAAARCKTVFDIAYGPHADQQLDIYLPSAPVRSAPVLVFAHGGGWTHGYKEWMGLMAPPLVDAGIVFISSGHRLAPEYKYPLPVEDCAAALGWVHRHIAAHGGDPNRIVVGGHSSGGHLLSMVALQPEMLRREGVPRNAIVACAPLSARLDLDFEGRLPGSVESRHHGMLFNDPSEAKPASPISHVDPTHPPMLLAWGRDDIPGVARSNERMRDALEARDQVHEAMLLEGDHFDTALDAGRPDNPWVRRIVSLLTEGFR